MRVPARILITAAVLALLTVSLISFFRSRSDSSPQHVEERGLEEILDMRH